MPDAATWDYQALAEQARHDIVEIKPLLEEVLEPDVLARSWSTTSAPAIAARRRALGEDRVRVRRGDTTRGAPASSISPTCSCRSTCGARPAFMSHTAHESRAVVQARLDSLCETFERLKPVLVASWSVEV